MSVTFIYAAYPLLQLGVVYNRVTALFLPYKYDKMCPIASAWVFIIVGSFYGTYAIAQQLF
ncbi:unnamed protein product, partial [Strongylus vulgaris]